MASLAYGAAAAGGAFAGPTTVTLGSQASVLTGGAAYMPAIGFAVGIGAALIIGISRAVGETMIVVMAAGLSANLSFNPLESVTTVTVPFWLSGTVTVRRVAVR